MPISFERYIQKLEEQLNILGFDGDVTLDYKRFKVTPPRRSRRRARFIGLELVPVHFVLPDGKIVCFNLEVGVLQDGDCYTITRYSYDYREADDRETCFRFESRGRPHANGPRDQHLYYPKELKIDMSDFNGACFLEIVIYHRESNLNPLRRGDAPHFNARIAQVRRELS